MDDSKFSTSLALSTKDQMRQNMSKFPLWSLYGFGLLFGLVPVAIYFYSIQYLPIADGPNLLSLMLASMVLGLFAMTILFLQFFASGLLWGMAIEGLRQRHRDDRNLSIEMAIDAMLFVLMGCFLAYVVHQSSLNLATFSSTAILLLSVGLVFAVINSLYFTRKEKHSLGKLFAFIMGTLLLLFTVGGIYTISASVMNNVLIGKVMAHRTFGAFLILMGLSNFCVTLLCKKHAPTLVKRYAQSAIGMIFISLLVMFVMFHKVTLIPNTLFSSFKLGNFRASLVVTQSQSNALAAAGIHSQCDPKGSCTTHPVTVLSRLGNEYYIQGARNSRDHAAVMRMIVPKSQVQEVITS